LASDSGVAEKIGAKAPTLLQNWLSTDDMANLLHLAGWELIKTDTRMVWPAGTPLLAPLLNRWLAPLTPHFCVCIVMVARPKPQPAPSGVSVFGGHSRPQRSGKYCSGGRTHARDGAGHGNHLHRRPLQGQHVGGDPAGHGQISAPPHQDAQATKQGKGGAVREAFAAATGDILFILDADLTMPPEELPSFTKSRGRVRRNL